MADDLLVKLGSKYLEYAQQEKKYKDMKDFARTNIIDELEKCDSDKFESSDFVINLKTTESKRFDTKKFKEDHPDLYEQYCNASESMRLTVKAKEIAMEGGSR